MCKHCEGGEPILKGNWWEVRIYNDYGERELSTEIDIGGYEGICESVEVDIKFCPMCGKELTSKSKYQIEENIV